MNHPSSHQFTLAKSICSLSPIHFSRNVSFADNLIGELILKMMVIIIMIVVVHGELQYNIF